MHELPDLSAVAWRRSTHSNSDQGACVEVSDGLPGVVPVRDSKDPSVGCLIVPVASWGVLTASLRG
ncbi:DUF397 domain-containing protein [Embleya sp. NBC_00888]|uniref:DUF397 domain-containing protein n=1 Tax=Embleya sp. NBC_00888 TaxID=2975960 RepID=UPI003870EC57|nr:DUF397 domain-containing protein [Embleya sp. NBC_00888]